MPEAQLEDFGSGLTPVTQGWFAQLGINVTVLELGQTGLYDAESNQEAFLVLQASARCSSRVRSDA